MKLLKTLTLATGLLVAASAASAADDTFKVGMVTYLTGDWGYPGTSTARSLEIAAEMYGKVLGKKIEPVIVDAQNPNNQVPEAQRLMSKDIKFFVQGYNLVPVPLARYIVDNGGLMADGTSWFPDLTEEGGYDNYFMFMPSWKHFSKTLVDYSLRFGQENLGKQPKDLKIALIGNPIMSYVGDEAARILKQRGLPPVIHETYSNDITDFTPLIAKMKKAGIDIVIPYQLGADAELYRRQAAGVGHTPPILLAAGVGYDQPEFANMGKAALGSMSLSYTVPEMREEFAPGLKEFKDRYRAKYGTQPVAHGLQTFATAMAFFQMIDKAGSFDLAKVSKTMASTVIERGKLPNYWGVKFDKNHNNLYADPLIIGQWVPDAQGKPVYRVVYPKELAVEKPVIPYFKQ
jgi:branched-chain amino acid transport system substrate-binding protein